MDNLDNLPLKQDTVHSSQEEEVMNKFFAPTGQKTPPRRSPPGEMGKNDLDPGRINWKIVGYTTILFLALANPWLDTLLCKVPYCGDNAIMLLGIKTLMFAILYLIISIFFG